MKHLFIAIALAMAGQHQGHVGFGEASVPGVSVQATQGDKTLRVVTDAEGRYEFPDLSETGTWTIQVEMLGFETLRQDVTVSKDGGPIKWQLKMTPLAEIDGEIPRGFPSVATPGIPTLQTSVPSPETANGLLINGSVSNGAATQEGLARAFGNNRFGGTRFPYRGSVTITGNNALFDARSFSLTGQNTPRPDYNRLQSSITLQGPLQIPRLFRKGQFGFTYSRTQNRNASV